MKIPEGAYPTWENAWPYSYSHQIKLGQIDPAAVPKARPTYGDYLFNPATEQERLANLQPYDITAGIKQAIALGLLDETTPWGVVFMNEEALPDLTPNNPAWNDKRVTMMETRYIRLELVAAAEPATWAGYAVGESGDVDTEDWLGVLNVTYGDWVYSYTLGRYIYLPQPQAGTAGAWTYFIK